MEVISDNVGTVTSVLAAPSCRLGQLLAEIVAYQTQEEP